jgi:hypothetical protein
MPLPRVAMAGAIARPSLTADTDCGGLTRVGAFPALCILAKVVPAWDTDGFFEFDRSEWPPYRGSECYLLGLLVRPNLVELAAKLLSLLSRLAVTPRRDIEILRESTQRESYGP